MSNMLADPSHWQLVDQGTGAVIAGPPAPNWNGAGYSPVPNTLLVGLIPQGAWLAGYFYTGASAQLMVVISPSITTPVPNCLTGTPLGIFESTGYQAIDLSAYEGEYVYLGIAYGSGVTSCDFAFDYYGALDITIPSATALATIEVTGCDTSPDCTPTLQPPGSGRNTPIVRVSERNGLTVAFPGETDRDCVQGTCPMPVCSDPAPGPEPECADFIIEADDQGWGPRNTLHPLNMNNLPEDFIPGSSQSPLLLVLGETTVEFYWDEGSEVYRNIDYLANLPGEEWPEASFMWGEGAVACVNVSFVPPQ